MRISRKCSRHRSSVVKKILDLAETPGVQLRVGGPVGMGEFPVGAEHIILHPFKGLNGSHLALKGSETSNDPDLFYTRAGALADTDMDMLVSRVKEEARDSDGPLNVMVFAGNSAWVPGQLAGEMKSGCGCKGSSWNVLPAQPKEVLLAGSPLKGSFLFGGGDSFWNMMQFRQLRKKD